MSDERKPLKLRWDVSPETVVVHASNVVLSRRNGYHVITFGQVDDPIVLSEEDAKSLQAKGTIRIKPVVRMSVSDTDYERIVKTFIEHLTKSSDQSTEDDEL